VEIPLSALKGALDYGAVANLSVEFKTGMIFDVRYNYGLNKLAGNLPWQNRNVAVSLGWKF